MKTIAISLDDKLIAAAEGLAVAESTTVEELVQKLLRDYVRLRAFDATSEALRGKLVVGRKLTRDEMNAR